MTELAKRISGVLGSPVDIELSLRNLSSLSEPETAELRAALERALATAGLNISGSAPVKVQVTFSENVEARIWIAEIRRNDVRDVAMVARKRPPAPQVRTEQPVEIRRRLILEQREAILDLVLVNDELLVLSPSSLRLLHRLGEGWETKQSFPLPRSRAWPRDARGRLRAGAGVFTAFLPGLVCEAGTDAGLRVSCREADPDWPFELDGVRLAPGRNYYTRRGLPPFFSVARLEQRGNTLWAFPGTDGRVRLFDRTLQEIGVVRTWGSDLAASIDPCGAGEVMMAALPAETQGESLVQAFEFANAQPVAISPAVELPGTLTALWPSQSKDAVLAVTRNSRNGNHAAFHLFLACGR